MGRDPLRVEAIGVEPDTSRGYVVLGDGSKIYAAAESMEHLARLFADSKADHKVEQSRCFFCLRVGDNRVEILFRRQGRVTGRRMVNACDRHYPARDPRSVATIDHRLVERDGE